jgi:hypothetical protein
MAFSLLPKSDKFQKHLMAMSAQAGIGARHLKNFVQSTDAAQQAEISRDIAACRASSKAIMGAMTEDLCRSFITPFDREDIQKFANYLYRIPKLIEKVQQRIALHDLLEARSDFLRQIDVIVAESEAMESMVDDLLNKRNTKAVTQKVALLHDLEQKGDDVLQDLLNSMFKENREARDLMLRKDIYDMLEKVIDSYRDAANVTLKIVLKYS